MAVILGLDTATSATAAALLLADGSVSEMRDDPEQGSRPKHSTHLLAFAEQLLARAHSSWEVVQGIAVGIGPGSFTGLRVGLAVARGLAQSLQVPLTGVPSTAALAAGALWREEIWAQADHSERRVLCVLDARRGEGFAAAYAIGREVSPRQLAAPRVLQSGELAQVGEALHLDLQEGSWLAVGDGAVRFERELSGAAVRVAAADSDAHRVSAGTICRLSVQLSPAARIEEVLPIYCRQPDAKPVRQPRSRRAGSEDGHAHRGDGARSQAAAMEAKVAMGDRAAKAGAGPVVAEAAGGERAAFE